MTTNEEVEAHRELALREFFRWAMTEGPFDGCDIDGASAQDKAEALGLIVKQPYDPAKHGEEHLSIMEPGQDLFVFAPGI